MDGGGLNDIWVTPRGLGEKNTVLRTANITGLSEPGVPGGVIAPSDFGRSFNPISTGGEGYAYDITNCPSGFLDLPMALYQASE